MRNINLFIFILFFTGCNNMPGTNISEKNMLGKWELRNRIGEKAFRNSLTIITFYNDKSFISIHTFDESGRGQREIKRGTYRIDGNKLIISREDNISEKIVWIFKNFDLLEYKTHKQNDPDGFVQGASFYLKKISDETDGDSK